MENGANQQNGDQAPNISGNWSTYLGLCKMIQENPRPGIKEFVKSNHDWTSAILSGMPGNTNDEIEPMLPDVSIKNLQVSFGALLISALIQSNFYDLAFDLLRQYPTMGRDSIDSRNIVLDALARKPVAFASGSQPGLLQRFIYNCIPEEEENVSSVNHFVGGDEENPNGGSQNYLGSLRQMITTTLFPCIKFLRDQKLRHMQAIEIVRIICEGVNWNDENSSKKLTESFHIAAKFGIPEIVDEIIRVCPQSVYWRNKDGQQIFHVAVIHRQEKVFNLVYHNNFLRNILAKRDNYGNNMLHFAGILFVPSSQVPGAVSQMQREFQWFKAIEDLMHEAHRERENKDKRTPRELFTVKHKELVKEGERWIKETASSCTVAVALIITVVFAAAFTLPGGNNANGLPYFLKDQTFLIFAISDALALFSLTTSLLMFLGILTSRYSKEDFLVSLPRKLIIGLITLFFSVASLMVAFSATIYLVLSHPWKWIIIPISLLGCVPVTLFALLQFPLLLDMFLSTYGSSIFERKRQEYM